MLLFAGRVLMQLLLQLLLQLLQLLQLLYNGQEPLLQLFKEQLLPDWQLQLFEERLFEKKELQELQVL